MDSDRSREIREWIRAGLLPDDVKKINELIVENDGVAYTQKKLTEISKKARTALDLFLASDVKQSLLGFIEFNRERTH
jgi:geranylgeranyl pyrophosphate synthase